MKYHSFVLYFLTRGEPKNGNSAKTVPGGQFKWGIFLLKGNGGVY